MKHRTESNINGASVGGEGVGSAKGGGEKIVVFLGSRRGTEISGRCGVVLMVVICFRYLFWGAPVEDGGRGVVGVGW